MVGDLALSRLLAINAADYPWLVLVPRRLGAAELADLGSDAFPLMAEIGLVSLALKDLTGCDTINDLRLLGIAFDDKNLRVITDAKGNVNVAISSLGWQ